MAGRHSENTIDKHVSKRLRFLRSSAGVTQKKLADEIGVSFQQLQKYENGKNRISAGRLYAIAKTLNVQVFEFYDGVE